jgi:hypothetical protein
MSAGGARPLQPPRTRHSDQKITQGKKNSADDADGSDAAAAVVSGSRPSDVADIEVTMVESHANLKVLSQRQLRQVLHLVAGLQGTASPCCTSTSPVLA